jgi:hypothetical protein
MTARGGVAAERFAVYRDISPTDVLHDILTDNVVALFVHQRDAERTAERLNEQPPAAAPCDLPSRATFRYAVWPGLHDFERIVVYQWTEKIVWGPSRDMRAAARVAATLNKEPIAGGVGKGGRT